MTIRLGIACAIAAAVMNIPTTAIASCVSGDSKAAPGSSRLRTSRPNGRTFTGKYVTDSYDNDGAVIPGLHAEGAVRGARIAVDD